MTTSIKITALNDIAGNLSYETLIPVVDMTGIPVTDKANLQIVGNLFLNGAGGANFAAAAKATVAATVTGAAQANITSVGTLTDLDVAGNISAANISVTTGTFSGDGSGLFNITADYATTAAGAAVSVVSGSVTANAQGNITSVGTLTELTVSGITDLGAIADVRIAGGAATNVLITDGLGNLSWSAGGAGTSGYSGFNGATGTSGYSGVDGATGTSGYSGINGTPYVNILYADLHTLWLAGTMVPLTYYRITDFQSVYDQPDYSALGVPKVSVSTLSGPTEPLLVLATSASTLDSQAWSATYPEDYIQYNIAFTQTEYMNRPAKGRIALRVDDTYNQTPYDMRGIVFKRYADALGNFTVVWDNGNASKADIPTFGITCENVRLSQHDADDPGFDDPVFYASNNVFGDYCESINAKGDFYNNTIGSFDPLSAGAFMYGTEFGHYCHDNTFGDNCNNNHIANEFSWNTLGTAFCNNTIGNGFQFNVIGENCQANTISGQPAGSGFTNNTIGTGFSNNSIGAGFSNPTITIGDDFSYNTIVSPFFNNVAIGASFTNNTINGIFTANTVGAGFTMNEIKCAVAGKDLTTVSISYIGISVEYIQTGDGGTLPPTVGQVYAGYFNNNPVPGPFGWIYTGV